MLAFNMFKLATTAKGVSALYAVHHLVLEYLQKRLTRRMKQGHEILQLSIPTQPAIVLDKLLDAIRCLPADHGRTRRCPVGAEGYRGCCHDVWCQEA